VTRPEDAFRAHLDPALDVVVTDLRMPGVDGLALCRRIVETRPDVPVVVMTAFGSLETAVGAIRAGAYDFVTKPVEADALQLTLGRALAHRQLSEQVRFLTEAVARAQSFDQLLGESPPMKRLFDTLSRIAGTDVSTLIVGESGSGKELVARALHEQGPRRSGAFVPVNCAAIPETLVESELFGHVKGAFTGAVASRVGLFAAAHRGTLFLDEVGDISLRLQQRLLRVLQEREVMPVGATRPQAVDVRVVAATHRHLEDEMSEGRFREDLFYRLNVFAIAIPPLRERRGDIPLLVEAGLERVRERIPSGPTSVSPLAMRLLRAYDWPGNVRELFSVVESSAIRAGGPRVEAQHLPASVRDPGGADGPGGGRRYRPREEDEERSAIEAALASAEGSRTRAAEILGMSRTTLWRRMRDFGIEGAGD
jgi:two-component system response regulator HydG